MNYPKKKSHILIVVLLLLCMPIVATAASAGSMDNPLITLEYVNGIMVPQIKADLYEQLKEEAYDDLVAQITEQVKEELKQEIMQDINLSFRTVYLSKGQKLTVKAGEGNSCEFIMDSGNGICRITDSAMNTAGSGLHDCSSGQDILNGQAVPFRHYLIIPKAGIGSVEITSEGGAYLMVRGAYEIVS